MYNIVYFTTLYGVKYVNLLTLIYTKWSKNVLNRERLKFYDYTYKSKKFVNRLKGREKGGNTFCSIMTGIISIT